MPCGGHGALLLADLEIGQSQSAASRPQLSVSTWVHWLNRNTALTFLLGRSAACAIRKWAFHRF